MWLLGVFVKSLNSYRKALKVHRYEWAKKAQVSTLLYSAYTRSTKEELQDIIRNFEKTGVLPPFNLVLMQDIACKTDGIVISNTEKLQVIRDAEIIINTSYVPKRNKELHSQRRISAYDFKFDGERLEELKEKFFIGKLHRIAWGRFLPMAFKFGKNSKRIHDNLENWKRTGDFLDELNYAGISQYVLEYEDRFNKKDGKDAKKK